MDTAAPPFTLPLEIEDIKAIIPHRYPFLLVDRIVELEPDVVKAAVMVATYGRNTPLQEAISAGERALYDNKIDLFRCPIGARCFANYGLTALDVAPITIGDDVYLGTLVQILAVNHVFADTSRPISHQGITVNGNVVNIPSYSVKVGDTIAVREKAKKQLRVTDAVKLAEAQGMPGWVQVDASKLEGVFKKAPDRDEFGADIKEALIVELYSR